MRLRNRKQTCFCSWQGRVVVAEVREEDGASIQSDCYSRKTHTDATFQSSPKTFSGILSSHANLLAFSLFSFP